DSSSVLPSFLFSLRRREERGVRWSAVAARGARGEARGVDEGDVEEAAVRGSVDGVSQAVVVGEARGAEVLDPEDAAGDLRHRVVLDDVVERRGERLARVVRDVVAHGDEVRGDLAEGGEDAQIVRRLDLVRPAPARDDAVADAHERGRDV